MSKLKNKIKKKKDKQNQKSEMTLLKPTYKF